MSPTTWLITGASRGIGFALTERLLQDESNIVVATCRNPGSASALQGLKSVAKGKLHVVKIDVADVESIRNSYEEVAAVLDPYGLDFLINNAGILTGGVDLAFSMDPSAIMTQMATNVVGPAVVAQTFLPLVEKSKKKTIINVSSFLGSLGFPNPAVCASYSITKTALNMLSFKQWTERPDLTVVVLDPGNVATDMTSGQAELQLPECIDGITKVFSGLTHADSGSFIRWNGERLPW